MTELAEAPAVEQGGAITRIPHGIGGKRVDGTSGRSGPVYNPALGVQSGAVDLASVEEIDAAVQNAAEAWESWRTTSLAKRARAFFRVRQLFPRHPRRARQVTEFPCGIPTLSRGQFSEQASTGIDVYSIRQPLGVVAGITPFNFP